MPANANRDESAAARTLVITRVYDAPARLLFEAYSKPEHVMQWFGPKGWPLTTCVIDFRVGGEFHFQMTGPDGTLGPPFGGTYLEIVRPTRIVYDNGFELPGEEKMVVTVTFDEQDGRTTLTMRTVFASAAMYAAHVGGGFEVGTNSGFDQLGDVVAALGARDRR